MQSKKEYSVHIAFAAALFLMAGGMMVIPQKDGGRYTLPAFGTAAAVSILLSVAVLPLVWKIYSCKKNEEKPRAGKVLLYSLTSILLVGAAAYGFSDFVRFVGDVMLPHTAKFWLAAMFFAATVLPAVGEKGIVMKFALFAFIFAAAVTVFFFAASVPQFRIDNISLHNIPEWRAILKQSVPIFLRLFPAHIIIYIYVGVFFGRRKGRCAVSGAVIGCAAIGICVTNALLLFGAPLAAKLRYPYAAAVSTVSLGELFTRMDGLSYFVYFAAQTVQTVMCVSVVRELFCRMGGKNTKKIAAFFLATSLAIGCIL